MSDATVVMTVEELRAAAVPGARLERVYVLPGVLEGVAFDGVVFEQVVFDQVEFCGGSMTGTRFERVALRPLYA
jgi:hypothetical protein